MPALSHDAHEGRRWSQRFFRSRQRLQALTLRKELDADGADGDAGFAVDTDESVGEGLSPSREDSSRERLRPLIRAHGKTRWCWGRGAAQGQGARFFTPALCGHGRAGSRVGVRTAETETRMDEAVAIRKGAAAACSCHVSKSSLARARACMATSAPRAISYRQIARRVLSRRLLQSASLAPSSCPCCKAPLSRCAVCTSPPHS